MHLRAHQYVGPQAHHKLPRYVCFAGRTSIMDTSLLTRPLTELMQEAAHLRDKAHTAITFSPKIFLPLTRLCRDTCGYCTFALPPSPGRRAFMTMDEVMEVARLGAAQGCTEALLTLGDKPEQRWPEAAEELAQLGFSSTLEYVEAAAQAVLAGTGLLPHINAGVMDQSWLRRFKRVSASQGLMLEGTAPSLMAPGGAHHGCRDKDPHVRLQVLEAAGREAVPFTTGILVGIGESRAERIDALHVIRDLHEQYGHIQEVIVQNFRAKQGTAMSRWAEPPLSELLWTCAAARIILGPGMNIQAPPNLTPEADDASAFASDGEDKVDARQAGWRALLDAGINDFGGISPITRDHVNPEAPWPHLERLSEATAAAGFHLLPRLPVYPEYMGLRGGPHVRSASRLQTSQVNELSASTSEWLDAVGGPTSIRAAVLRAADSSGLTRGSTWYAGLSSTDGDHADTTSTVTLTASTLLPEALRSAEAADGQPQGSGQSYPNTSSSSNSSTSSVPRVRVRQSRLWHVSTTHDGDLHGLIRPKGVAKDVQSMLDEVLQAVQNHAQVNPLSVTDITRLLSCRGSDAMAVRQAADRVRATVCGDKVTYVVNRNINYTNVCTLKCGFCAFSKGKASEELRGPAYLVSLDEISRRTAEAWDRGATEVCMQGGIHPSFTGHTYLDILKAAKHGAPDIHVHAFSPLEVHQGASSLGLSLEVYLTQLKDAGLGSLPGTAAEVLCDDVRSVLCPDKISTDRWIEVVGTAHRVGLRSTSTLMFGHLESGPHAWAKHLVQLRELQAVTGGITEFVPLPFVHMEAPVYLKGFSRKGPTLHECITLHAVARLALHPHITNIQASWVKMGPKHAASLLQSGCNDMGGSLMNESITRAAGASHGQELPPTDMEALIIAAGRVPQQRTTLYGYPPNQQTSKSFMALSLMPVQNAKQ